LFSDDAIERFKLVLVNASWDEVYAACSCGNDPNESYSMFTHKYADLFNIHFFYKDLGVQKRILPSS